MKNTKGLAVLCLFALFYKWRVKYGEPFKHDGYQRKPGNDNDNLAFQSGMFSGRVYTMMFLIMRIDSNSAGNILGYFL